MYENVTYMRRRVQTTLNKLALKRFIIVFFVFRLNFKGKRGRDWARRWSFTLWWLPNCKGRISPCGCVTTTSPFTILRLPFIWAKESSPLYVHIFRYNSYVESKTVVIVSVPWGQKTYEERVIKVRKQHI